MRLRPSLLLAAILAFPLSSTLASQIKDTPAKPPVFRTNTRAVVVDVVVTKADEPITGLHAKDFTILEDGKPQTIDFFEEHTAKTLPADALKPLPAMPPGVYTNVPPAPPSDSVNVLLLDSLNTDKEDQAYVHNQIMHFLQTMQPGAKVAIFTLASQLRMVQGFTTDTSVLRNALNDPKYGVTPTKTDVSRSIQDKYDDVEHIEKMQMMLNGHTDEGITAVASFQRDFASFQGDQRVGMTLEALQNLARYLAQVPGRKNLIWFSSSFPVSVFPHIGETQHPNQMNTNSLRDYSKKVKETADLLTVSQIAVYPVGAEGMMSEHVFEASLPSPTDYEASDSGLSGASQAKGGCMSCYTNENAARSDKIMSMEQLASDTGGKAYFNTNDLNAAMQHAIADGSHYYTIVYAPTNKKMDGSYRRIEVKIPDAKYKLAYRRGYNADNNLASDAKSDSKPDSDPLHPLMTLGLPSATQLLYAVHVIPANPQPAPNAPRAGRNSKLTGPVRRYGVDFMIRWTDIKLDSAPDGRHTGKVQVELLAYDHDGKAINWAGGTQMMDITPDLYAAIQRSGLPAHIDIDIPADTDVYLQTGVYDWSTGKAGTLSVPLPAQDTRTASTAH
jgi:VWFA-related protein